jgi:acyl carrier protein
MKKTMTHEKLVREFFAEHGKNALPDGKEAFDVHYLDAELIDSFGIITMISDFEGALGITFSSEDKQSYEFQTVGGLISIIDRLAAAAKA